MPVVGAGERAQEGSSSGETNGSVSQEKTDAATACRSFCVEVGGGAGADGVGLSVGRAQHAGVAHRLKSHPVQQQLRFVAAMGVAVSAEAVKTPCKARTNPSNSTNAVFTSRDAMLNRSF